MRLSRLIDCLGYSLSKVLRRFECLEPLTNLETINSNKLKSIKLQLQGLCLFMKEAKKALQEIPHSPDVSLINHEDAAAECVRWFYEIGAAEASQPNMTYTPCYDYLSDTWSINLELDCFNGRKEFKFVVNYDGKIIKFGEVFLDEDEFTYPEANWETGIIRSLRGIMEYQRARQL